MMTRIWMYCPHGYCMSLCSPPYLPMAVESKRGVWSAVSVIPASPRKPSVPKYFPISMSSLLNVGFSLYFIYYKINFFTYPLIDFVQLSAPKRILREKPTGESPDILGSLITTVFALITFSHKDI